MTYFIVGEQSLIQKEIEDLLVKYNSQSIIKYDLEQISICNVIDDINTINLFSDLKVIICSNLNKIDHEEVLINYLNHQNNNILIITETEKIEEKKKIIKEIRKFSKVIDVSNINLNDYIKYSFEDYKISNMTINLLKDYCNSDFNRLKEEINKLKMYKLEEKEISDADVKKLVKKSLDKNIFDLTDAINKGNKNKIFDIYYELLNNNEDEIKVLSILANNFRLLYKIKELIKDYNDEECISKLKIHPYRFKLLKENSYKYSIEKLLYYLQELGNVDLKIKSGEIDKKTAMELFLLKID